MTPFIEELIKKGLITEEQVQEFISLANEKFEGNIQYLQCTSFLFFLYPDLRYDFCKNFLHIRKPYIIIQIVTCQDYYILMLLKIVENYFLGILDPAH